MSETAQSPFLLGNGKCIPNCFYVQGVYKLLRTCYIVSRKRGVVIPHLRIYHDNINYIVSMTVRFFGYTKYTYAAYSYFPLKLRIKEKFQ